MVRQGVFKATQRFAMGQEPNHCYSVPATAGTTEQGARPGSGSAGHLHGAALVENGKGLLVIGPSGSGKSTIGT